MSHSTSPGDLTLRLTQAGEWDAASVAAVINDAFSKYDFVGEDRTSAEDLPVEVGPGEFILAEREGRLVGTAMVRPSLEGTAEDGGEHRHTSALYLGLVAVLRAHHGSGIGRTLVARAETIAKERGFEQVILGTLAEMGNVQYYEELGYRTVSRERFPAGHWGVTIEHWQHVMLKEINS